MNHFLSTSTYYLEKWFRNFFSVPWSLHASMESSSCSMTCSRHWPSIEWFCKCSTSAHSFSLVDCVVVPWGPLSLWVVSLVLVNDFHHWPVIRCFLPCSTPTNLFAWLDSYIGLIEIAMKTLGHLWFWSRVRGDIEYSWLYTWSYLYGSLYPYRGSIYMIYLDRWLRPCRGFLCYSMPSAESCG